jgi:hypothetical protein
VSGFKKLFNRYGRLVVRDIAEAIDDLAVRFRARTRRTARSTLLSQNMIQTKGTANRAPVDDYLPYVQDFIKSDTWGEVGDLANARVRKLSDGRYITEAQFAEGVKRAIRETNLGWNEDWYEGQERAYAVPSARLSDGLWVQIAPYFDGYAVGGRVDASRCFSRNSLSVRNR